jgi:hypothetical protein
VHFSGTEQERAAAELSTDQEITSYFCDESSVESSFLKVWNEGTPEYEEMGMAAFVEALPFEQIMTAHYPKDGHPDKRGNLQVNFGFAGGNSHEQRSSEQVFADYGVAVPSTKTGTMTSLVVQTFKAMSALAKKVGVIWTRPQFLKANPTVKDRIGRFAHKIHKICSLELLSSLFMVLDGKTQIEKHTDNQNCPDLPEVLTCSRVLRNPLGQ